MLRTPSNRDEMFVDVGMYGVPGQERFVQMDDDVDDDDD